MISKRPYKLTKDKDLENCLQDRLKDLGELLRDKREGEAKRDTTRQSLLTLIPSY